MRNLSFINLGLATLALRKSDNRFQLTLSIGKFLTAIADVHVNVRAVKAFKIEKGLIKSVLKKSPINATRVGYATAIIDVAEAGLNFWERDYDASAAYAVSAALAIAGAVNGWNPIGWTLLLVGACVGFYAAYLEDSPLERIAKNGVFGEIPSSYVFWDAVDFKKGNHVSLIKQHVLPTTRDGLHKAGFTAWEHYPKQYEALMDILVSGRISVKIETETQIGETLKVGYYSDKSNTSLSKYQVTQIEVSTYFGSYLTHKELLDYELFYLPDGLGKQAIPVKNKLCKSTPAIYNQKDKPPTAKWFVEMDKLTNFNAQSILVVLCRANINDSQYFPIPKKTTPRYIGAAIPIIRREYQSGFYYNNGLIDRIFVGTQHELINKDKWR